VTSVFISDCEGPIAVNDNAFELTSHFVPHGNRFYTVISRYDDVLADALQRPNYKAGDTLKLILPFLKAYDVTDSKMLEFSSKNLVLIRNAEDMLEHVRKIAPAFIVSTSYEHYIKALCKAVGFPYENTYCTKLGIDRYHLTQDEKAKLKSTASEITKMSIIEIPATAKSLNDFSEKEQKILRRLDDIFWKEIKCTDCGRMFSEVNPVGGKEKAEAIKDIVCKLSVDLSDVVYVGDSITDIEAFNLVKKGGGLTVSFNGNKYAIRHAEIAVLSETSLVTAIVADIFCRFGKQQAVSLAEKWSRKELEKNTPAPAIVKRLLKQYPRRLPKVKIITSQNMETLTEESSKFREKVRGKAIGRLG
jgi:energy-converting hydrogenase A subunit R